MLCQRNTSVWFDTEEEEELLQLILLHRRSPVEWQLQLNKQLHGPFIYDADVVDVVSIVGERRQGVPTGPASQTNIWFQLENLSKAGTRVNIHLATLSTLLDVGSEGGQPKQQVVCNYIDHIYDVCIVNGDSGFWMPMRGRLGAKRPPLFKLEPHHIEQHSMYLSSEGTYVCKAFSPRCYVIQKVSHSTILFKLKEKLNIGVDLKLYDVVESC